MTVRLATLNRSRLTRVVQYSYLLSIPLITAYAVGFSIIKYTYGFTVVPTVGGGIPSHNRCIMADIPSHARTLSTMESICTKSDIPSISLTLYQLGTRNVSLSFIVVGRRLSLAQGVTPGRYTCPCSNLIVCLSITNRPYRTLLLALPREYWFRATRLVPQPLFQDMGGRILFGRNRHAVDYHVHPSGCAQGRYPARRFG